MIETEQGILAAQKDLEKALAALYSAFAHYQAPRSIKASPLRDATTILVSLSSLPLAELGAEALGYYASTAMTTVGSPDDFKHFLPRILHFACHDATQMGYEPEIVASKLILAGWVDWPVSDRTAVADLFYSAWSLAHLQHIDFQTRSWNWICAMAMLDLQFETCLQFWTASPVGNAMLQLAEGGREIKSLQRANGYWSEVRPEKRKLILDWLGGRAVENALMETIDKVDAKDQWQIERMLDDIEEFRRCEHKT